MARHFDSMVFGIVLKSPRTDLFVQSWQLAHLSYIGNSNLVTTITPAHVSPELLASTDISGLDDVQAGVLRLSNKDVVHAGSAL